MASLHTFPAAVHSLELYQEKLPEELDDRLGEHFLPTFAQTLDELTASPEEIAKVIFEIAANQAKHRERVGAAAIFLANTHMLVDILTDDPKYTAATVESLDQKIQSARQDLPRTDKKALDLTRRSTWQKRDEQTNRIYRMPKLSQQRLSVLAKRLERQSAN